MAEELHTAVATCLPRQAIVHKRISNASATGASPYPALAPGTLPASPSRPAIPEPGSAMPSTGNDRAKPERLNHGQERRSPWSVPATAPRCMRSTIFPTSPTNSCGAMPIIALSTPQPRATPPPRMCLGYGACTFLFDPADDPKSEPACWRADACPFVLRINGPRGTDWLPASSLPDLLIFEGERYLVMRSAVGAHRVEIAINTTGSGPTVELPLDAALCVRLACLQAYASGTSAVPVRLRPTAYQAGRLALMLAILDLLDNGDNPAVDARAIAAELVYPGAKLPHRAIEWKSSSLRRQTLRLVTAAKSMRDHGFRGLLHGQIPAAASRHSMVPAHDLK